MNECVYICLIKLQAVTTLARDSGIMSSDCIREHFRIFVKNNLNSAG